MADEHSLPPHESRGHGNLLRCPKIMGDVACQGCDCTTPCKEAQDYPDGVYMEEVKRGRASD